MTCQINPADFYQALNNPATQPGFVLSDYGDPLGPPGGEGSDYDVPIAWSIRIFYGQQYYEFGWFYAPDVQPMDIQKVYGAAAGFKFGIADYRHERQLVPFVPVEEMYCEVWAGSHRYAIGFIRDVNPVQVNFVRADGTEATDYIITVGDLYQELERKAVLANPKNKKLGFILRDVIRRWTTLDPSDIDPDLGFEVAEYPINDKAPSQVLAHINSLTDTTFFIETSTRKLKVLGKDDPAAAWPVEITDANVYDWFEKDSFSIRRQSDLTKNLIKFWFSERYTAGTVNVANGSNIVVGFGSPPETSWDDLPAGLQFKLANSDAVYNVEKNNSSGATQELRLSSAFAESTASDEAYELRGNRRPIIVSDEQSIGQMSQLRGDDGIFTYVVSEDQNFFTPTEARQFAQALLALARPLPKGQARTWNDVWQFLPNEAGMVIPFNLPLSKRFVGNVVVQEIRIQDLGGFVRIGEEEHPYCQIDFSFTSTLNSTQIQLRKMMQDLRKVKINDDPVDIIDIARLPETLIFKDCIHALDPVQITDILSLLEQIEARDISGDPLFYTEQHYTLNDFDYSFTSD